MSMQIEIFADKSLYQLCCSAGRRSRNKEEKRKSSESKRENEQNLKEEFVMGSGTLA